MLIGLHGAILIAMNLLAVAFATACSARCKTRFWRWFWPVAMAVVMLSGVLTSVLGGFYLFRQNIAPRWFFGFFLALFLVSAAGAVVVLRRGLLSVSEPWRRLPLVTLLALSAALNIIVLEQMQSRSMLDLARVQSEAAGYLLSQMPGHVPPAANACRFYEQAIRMLGDDGDLPDGFAESVEPGGDPAVPALHDFLAGKAAVLDLAAKGAALPFFSPQLEGLNTYEWPMPDLRGYRNLGILLTLAAKASVLSGDVPAALERLDQVRRLAGHLALGPFLISRVLADNIDSMRLRGLEYLLAKTEIPAARLAAAPALPGRSSAERFRQALCIEGQGQLHGFTLAAATPDIHAMAGSLPKPLAAPNAVTRMWRAYFLPADLTAARDIIARQMCLPADSFAELKGHLDAIDQAQKAGQMGILSTIAAPDFTNALTLAMRHDALEKLAAVALAAAAFRESHGRWPADMAALIPDFMPAVPVDPFDGNPLKMRPVAGGLELFSAGPPTADGRKGPVRFYLGAAAYDRHRDHSTPQPNA